MPREDATRAARIETRETRELPVRRPLLPVFLICALGDGLARGAGLGPSFVMFAFLVWLAAWGVRRLGPERWHLQGVGMFPLGLLFLVAAARGVGSQRPDGSTLSPARHVGTWRVLHEGEDVMGKLEGGTTRFEVPAGTVRDGEWVELFPTREPSAPARGPVDVGGGSGFAAPIELLPDEVRRIAPAGSGITARCRRALRRWRRAGLARLDRMNDPLVRGLAAALLFGDRSELPAGLTDLFTRTGTRHALAVSGLHVALVAGLWIWPLGALLAAMFSRLPRTKRLAHWLRKPELWRVLLLAIFAPMAGAGAPVVRATLALAVAQLAGFLPARGVPPASRRVDALSLWALAGFLEWLVDPAGLQTISMRLSYSATLGLIVMAAPLSRWTRAQLPNGGHVEETNRAGRPRHPLWRLLVQRSFDLSHAGLVASCAASLATLPIAWSVFGEWSVAGPFATLALLPLLACFMGLAWAWFAVPVDWIESVLGSCARGLVALLEFCDRWPGTPLPLPQRPLWLLCIATGAALFAACRFALPARAWVRIAAFSWGAALLPWWKGARGLEVYVLDVGHGTAAVLRAPGAGCWVFDGGSRDRPRVDRGALFPLLRELDVGRLTVALSHGEADHARALPWLIERFPPERWLGALPAQVRERLPHDCLRLDLERGRLDGEAGRPGRVPWSWSLLRGFPGDGNEGSRSLEWNWGAQRVLLCGDAEEDGLGAQIRTGAIRGPYDLALFPHHGSETPWLTPFLEAAEPAEVWFSSSATPPIAAELDRRELPWRATATEGPLVRRW